MITIFCKNYVDNILPYYDVMSFATSVCTYIIYLLIYNPPP